jgi:hypothetical protein
MNRPTAAATPTPAFRRLVLGIALLAGLTSALALRTPALHAQPSPPPAAEAGQSAPPKSVTISSGRGVEAKIEIRDSTEPGAKAAAPAGPQPDAEGTPPAEAGTAGARNRSATVGKHARIKVDGLGKDREFDSFEEFVHDEPAIAAMVVAIVTVVFLAPVMAIGLILWYRMRKARMLNETMLALAEKGIVTPAAALEALSSGKQDAIVANAAGAAPLYEQARQIRRRAAWSDLRKGVLTGGVGLALTLYSLLEDREPNSVGLILLFVGIGFVVLWWFEDRQLAPPGNGVPGAGAPAGVPGGRPPSA